MLSKFGFSCTSIIITVSGEHSSTNSRFPVGTQLSRVNATVSALLQCPVYGLNQELTLEEYDIFIYGVCE